MSMYFSLTARMARHRQEINIFSGVRHLCILWIAIVGMYTSSFVIILPKVTIERVLRWWYTRDYQLQTVYGLMLNWILIATLWKFLYLWIETRFDIVWIPLYCFFFVCLGTQQLNWYNWGQCHVFIYEWNIPADKCDG